jgi:hypothetical protein
MPQKTFKSSNLGKPIDRGGGRGSFQGQPEKSYFKFLIKKHARELSSPDKKIRDRAQARIKRKVHAKDVAELTRQKKLDLKIRVKALKSFIKEFSSRKSPGG